uniref:Uncharacterized protein n=1 Tax=Bracon brevicornis TaxID=1563983 RepID=A0A6V7KRD3_9HYME
MDKIQLNFEPYDLVQLAYIKIAQTLWTSYEIRTYLKNSFNRNDKSLPSFNPHLCRVVATNGKTLPLTRDEKRELLIYIFKISPLLKPLYQVFYEVPRRGAALIDFIKWMPIGDLDIGETIRSSYFAGMLEVDKYTWIVLSVYGLVDCMIDFVRKTDIKPLTEDNYIQPYSSPLPIIWAYYFDENNKKAFPKWTQVYMGVDFEEEQSEKFLARLCYDNLSALKYFWNCSEVRVKRYLLKDTNETDGVPLNAQTATFLWSQWYNFHRKPNFSKILWNEKIFDLFMQWPYHELLLDSLAKSWYRFNLEDQMRLWAHVRSHVKRDFKKSPHNKKYNSIFAAVWKDLHWHLKDDYINLMIFFHLSPSILALIINDRELRENRDEMIAYVNKIYRRIYNVNERKNVDKKGMYDIMPYAEKFCQEVLIYDTDDKEKFIDNVRDTAPIIEDLERRALFYDDITPEVEVQTNFQIVDERKSQSASERKPLRRTRAVQDQNEDVDAILPAPIETPLKTFRDSEKQKLLASLGFVGSGRGRRPFNELPTETYGSRRRYTRKTNYSARVEAGLGLDSAACVIQKFEEETPDERKCCFSDLYSTLMR